MVKTVENINGSTISIYYLIFAAQPFQIKSSSKSYFIHKREWDLIVKICIKIRNSQNLLLKLYYLLNIWLIKK